MPLAVMYMYVYLDTLEEITKNPMQSFVGNPELQFKLPAGKVITTEHFKYHQNPHPSLSHV